MTIKFLTTGGTIDKVYFDSKGSFQVGDSILHKILTDARVGFDFEILSILKKDSLDITTADRDLIRSAILSDPCEHFIVTHGTDTMVETAKHLQAIADKTIVLTGSLQPARFKETDAEFNLGAAISAVQILPNGIFIAMHGKIFHPDHVRKNQTLNCFESF